MKTMVLKDFKGDVVRTFRCETKKVYLVYRKNKGRLDFCNSPDFFGTEFVILVDEFYTDQLKQRPVPGTTYCVEACEQVKDVRKETPWSFSPLVDTKLFRRIFVFTVGAYIMCAVSMYNFFIPSAIQIPVLETQLVKVIKPATFFKAKVIAVSKQASFNRNSNIKSNKPILKKSLKKLGVLSTLGNLSKSQTSQAGGLKLLDSQISVGPGLRAVAGTTGSGGVQSQLYSKGMIPVALGTGGNIKGGGGHGTKGTKSGGGASGYGELNLIGSQGSQELTGVFSSQAVAIDFNIIDRKIIEKRSKIRECYSTVSKTEPDIKGLFKFDFQINTKGRVISSKIKPSSPIQSKNISSCIFQVINQIVFPIKLTANTMFNYAFDLSDLENQGGY